MNDHYYAVIMAGGGGTRLWPLSRQDKPKQLLRLVGERTMFQIAVDRLLGLLPINHIFVVTSKFQADMFQEMYPELPAENFIIEPCGRDTAAAIGLSAVTLKKHDPQAVMAVVTADHFIEREARFLHVLRAAYQVAEEGYLVTLGIHPTFPSTGFGYIQQGDYLGTYEGIVAFTALNFKEKPDDETARKFVEAEDHSWNSGMFIWKVGDILSEVQRQMPQLHQALEAIDAAWSTQNHADVLARVWDGLDKVSVDFGIMEGAEKVAVIPARGLGWSDVGSWNTVFDVLPKDLNGNVVNTERHLNQDSSDSLVFTNGEGKRLIVTIGVHDLIIVDTGDVLLVCDKEHAQDVREVVNRLKEEDHQDYL